MKKIDKTYSNPRMVNDQGGMLIRQDCGRDLYIDSSHAQYIEIKDGSIGKVQKQIIKNQEITSEAIGINDIVEAINELIQRSGTSVKNSKFKMVEK